MAMLKTFLIVTTTTDGEGELDTKVVTLTPGLQAAQRLLELAGVPVPQVADLRNKADRSGDEDSDEDEDGVAIYFAKRSGLHDWICACAPNSLLRVNTSLSPRRHLQSGCDAVIMCLPKGLTEGKLVVRTKTEHTVQPVTGTTESPSLGAGKAGEKKPKKQKMTPRYFRDEE